MTNCTACHFTQDQLKSMIAQATLTSRALLIRLLITGIASVLQVVTFILAVWNVYSPSTLGLDPATLSAISAVAAISIFVMFMLGEVRYSEGGIVYSAIGFAMELVAAIYIRLPGSAENMLWLAMFGSMIGLSIGIHSMVRLSCKLFVAWSQKAWAKVIGQDQQHVCADS